MPTVTKICSAPGCNEATKESKCLKHKQEAKPFKGKVRIKKFENFYSSARWRRLRLIYLRKHPLCVQCVKKEKPRIAEVVDHITPIRKDWNKRYLWRNLQSLCKRCHNKKTGQEGGRGGI